MASDPSSNQHACLAKTADFPHSGALKSSSLASLPYPSPSPFSMPVCGGSFVADTRREVQSPI